MRLILLVVCVVSLSTARIANATSYKARLLSPPDSYVVSHGFGIYENEHVGAGWGSVTSNEYHALYWHDGTPEDLNPTGFSRSFAQGVSGSIQVGYGSGSSTGSMNHALLWSGTADSVIDLNPNGFQSSVALGISANIQIGYGSGTPASVKNHALLMGRLRRKCDRSASQWF